MRASQRWCVRRGLGRWHVLLLLLLLLLLGQALAVQLTRLALGLTFPSLTAFAFVACSVRVPYSQTLDGGAGATDMLGDGATPFFVHVAVSPAALLNATGAAEDNGGDWDFRWELPAAQVLRLEASTLKVVDAINLRCVWLPCRRVACFGVGCHCWCGLLGWLL